MSGLLVAERFSTGKRIDVTYRKVTCYTPVNN